MGLVERLRLTCRDVGFAESGLEAWEDLGKENRPERAADFGALFPKGNLRQKRLDGISETKI